MVNVGASQGAGRGEWAVVVCSDRVGERVVRVSWVDVDEHDAVLEVAEPEEDVDRRGFGSADRPRESVAYGESRIQWEPGKTGLSFRAEAFDTFIQVLALLGDADVATAAKIGHTLLRQRLVKSKCRHKRVASGLAKM